MKNFHSNFKNIYLSLLLVFSFFTNFRYSNLPIGISEILFIPALLYSIYIFIFKQLLILNIKREKMIILFALIIITFLMIISFNLNLLNSEFKHVNMLHNLLAFIYLTLLVFIFIILNPNLEKTFQLLILFYFIFCIFLFIYSFYNDEIFGKSLYYSNTNYKSLFTKNHHQFAFFTIIIIFLSLHYLIFHKNLIFIFPVIFLLYLFLQTESLGNLMSFYVSIFSMLIIFLLIKINTYKLSKPLIFSIFSIILISIYFSSLNIQTNKFIYEIISNKNVLFRTDFIGNYIEKTNLFNFLFGHGPGAYVVSDLKPNHFRELHNTFGDLLMYVGFVSFIILIYIYFKIIAKLMLKNNYILLGLTVYIIFYSVTHNIARYPIFWIYFIFILTQNFNEKQDVI